MTPPPDVLIEESAAVLRLAREDPRQAEREARQVRDRAARAGDLSAESTAWRAMGLAARGLHQIPEALRYMRTAVEVAERTSDYNLVAEARLGLAGVLMLAGATEEAMAILGETHATGETAVLVASQRAMALGMLGHYEQARRAYGPVVSGFRRLGDKAREARALGNRGLLHVYTGRFSQADADLARAEEIMTRIGHLTEAATICQNRGFAAARKGDLPAALAFLEEGERRCRDLGVHPTGRALTRASTLASAGLLAEASEVAKATVAQFREGGDESYLAEGLVLLADIALLSDSPTASRTAAEEAGRLFEQQKKAAWCSLAHAAIARAGLAEGFGTASMAALASDAADHLDEMRLADQATMARSVAGQLWLSAGQEARGTTELERAGSRRRSSTAAGRLAAWEALGRARLARGDRRGAMTAMNRALAVVDEQQSSLMATELRAHVSVHARAAAGLGLQLAVQGNRATCIWQWMERHRANSLRPIPARPPRDETLAGLLAELRNVAQEITSYVTEGKDPTALLSRQSDLERRGRERAWKASANARARTVRRAAGTPSDLARALEGATLVEFGEVDGFFHAVVLAGGRWRHRRLAAAPDVLRELGHVRMALRRMAYSEAKSALAAGAQEQLWRAAGALDDLMFGPIARMLGPGPVVVVPTGELFSAPWAALPALFGRTVSVAPSGELWLEATSRARHSRRQPAESRQVVVAGPGLAGADREARRIGSLYPRATVLTGAQAHAAAVTRALEGANLAHIAAHARFRADNGLWSSLELADGGLTVYDLELLRHPPQVVILSACQSGLSAVHSGDEIVGLVAALLHMGTHAVVASVVPVEDRASEQLMVALHERLGSGQSPAVALAGAQGASAAVVGLSYVCFGSL
ncbi:MAG TPA: CHAT domain-containing protein [Acidimicrobiales bacterium]|nr:CHAT domain-containing protein [Acidimicrobiales bacterium]